MTPKARVSVLALVSGIALIITAGASAHAIVSPPVAAAKKLQQFTLSVPTEKEGAMTTKIELTVPQGFAIDSFEPTTAGWKQQVQSTGSGPGATPAHLVSKSDAHSLTDAAIGASGSSQSLLLRLSRRDPPLCRSEREG